MVDPDLQHCMKVVVTTALGIQLGEDDHGMRIVKVTGKLTIHCKRSTVRNKVV